MNRFRYFHQPLLFRLCLVCALLILLLVACRARPTAEPTPTDVAELSVVLTETFSAAADETMRNLVQEWGGQNNVNITFVDPVPAARVGGAVDAAAAEETPDCGTAWELHNWMASGALVETTEIIADLQSAAGGYLEKTLLPSRMAGKQWAVPYTVVNSVFFVREDRLKRAGLPLPDTWEDALMMAEAITVPDEFWGWGLQIGASGDTETAFRTKLWSYGGSVWNTNGEPALDSPATRQVLALMQRAWLAGSVPPDAPEWNDASNNDAYMAGQVGMVLNAGSLLYRLQTEDPALLANTAILSPPAGPAERFSPGDIRHWVIFRTPRAERCSELTRWLFAPAQIEQLYAVGQGYFLPVYRDLLDAPFWQADPHRQVMATAAANTVVTGYPGAITPWAMEARADAIIGTMIRHVLLEGQSVDAAIATAHAALQERYDRWHLQ